MQFWWKWKPYPLELQALFGNEQNFELVPVGNGLAAGCAPAVVLPPRHPVIHTLDRVVRVRVNVQLQDVYIFNCKLVCGNKEIQN